MPKTGKKQSHCNRSGIRELIWANFPKYAGNIAAVYAAVIALVFPFFCTDKYFRILHDRYRFFWIATAIAAAAILFLVCLYTFRSMKERYYEGLPPADLSCLRDGRKITAFIRRNVSPADAALVLFLAVVILSTVLSDWPKEAFWGSDGRFQGCFLWLWYGAAYLIVSRFLGQRSLFLKLLVTSGGLVCLWGITDALGLDIFGWLKAVKAGQEDAFMSSVGNINTYTALLAIFLGLSGGCFLSGGDVRLMPFYGVLFCLSAAGMITGRSDNAAIGMGVCMAVLLLLAVREREKSGRMSVLTLLLMLAFGMSAFILKKLPHPAYLNESSGILLGLCVKWETYVFLGGLAAVLLLYRAIAGKRVRKYAPYAVLCVYLAMIAAVLFAVREVNRGVVRDLYVPFMKWLKFDDRWGSTRGMPWRMAIEHMKEFPLLNKLIGTGPETFGLVLKRDNYDEMVTISGVIFDSPHNELLQYLFTTGILGAVSYYAFLIFCLADEYRASKIAGSEESTYGIGIVTAVIAYTAVSFVNISVPITQAFLIMLLGCTGGKRVKNREK